MLAPATIDVETDALDEMHWAAVRTKLFLRRVPLQMSFPDTIKTCHGFEFLGLSTVPPTIRPDAKIRIELNGKQDTQFFLE